MSKPPNHREKDMISELPDEFLHCIISSLSIDEICRTSILSKRWKHLWKNVLHLDFDRTYMNKPLSTRKLSDTREDAIKYGNIVNNMLQQHKGNLFSCSFKHSPLCLGHGVVNTLVEFVVEERKELSSLSLECLPSYDRSRLEIKYVMDEFKPKIFSSLCSLELTNYKLKRSVLSAFESCEKLRSLKLGSMFVGNNIISGILENCFGLEKFSLIDSKVFDHLKIVHQSLKTLEFKRLNVKGIEVHIKELQNLVVDSLICPPKGFRIYSEKLSSFYSTCDPSNHRIQMSKYFLEYCSGLLVNNNAVSSEDYDCILPYDNSMFWEKREKFNELKFVTIKGFTGKEQEVKFAEFLITKSYVMEKIYIICGSEIANKVKHLLSLPKRSSRLSIALQ